MSSRSPPGTRPSIIDIDGEEVLVAGETEDGVRLASLRRESGAIDVLEIDEDAARSAMAAERSTLEGIRDANASRLHVGRIVDTFQKQPGPECANFWYGDQGYKHRIEGILVEFEHPPTKIPMSDLRLATTTIGSVLQEKTNLIGLGDTTKLLPVLTGMQTKAVTFAGYDVDKRTEYTVNAQIHHGLAAGKADSVDAMQTYQQRGSIGLSHIVEFPSSGSDDLLKSM